jgi:hypothetical protein
VPSCDEKYRVNDVLVHVHFGECERRCPHCRGSGRVCHRIRHKWRQRQRQRQWLPAIRHGIVPTASAIDTSGESVARLSSIVSVGGSGSDTRSVGGRVPHTGNGGGQGGSGGPGAVGALQVKETGDGGALGIQAADGGSGMDGNHTSWSAGVVSVIRCRWSTSDRVISVISVISGQSTSTAVPIPGTQLEGASFPASDRLVNDPPER